MKPLPASKALEAFYLEARCKLLDLAAILDRLNRGEGADQLRSDPRYVKIQDALKLLQASGTGRAEAIQLLFSLPYQEGWEIPQPRG